MQSSHVMVIMIILIVIIASVFRAKYRFEKHSRDQLGGRDDAETQRLREELKVMRERLQVLERITVEKENSLEREIENLRDR
jgi:cbb3-type cytochrome oxidase subunit 3